MLLKRSIVLAAGVLLFIAAFLIYFEVSNMQMEARFRAERKKFNVDGVNLTAAPDASSPAPPPSSSPPDSAPDTNAAPAPAAPDTSAAPAAMDSTSTPAPVPAAPDANSAPATPDTNSPPASPDTNSAPMTPAPSTMNEPRGNSSPFQPASYNPFDGAMVQYRMSDPPTSASLTNRPTTGITDVTVTTTTGTNNAPSTNGGSVEIPSPTATNAPPAAPAAAGSVLAHPAGGEGKVIVLLYHQFKAPGVKIPAMYQWTMNSDVFESEMKYIHDNGYHVIPMSDLLKFLKHQITLPSNCVCITIDDGYKSAIVYAAPILKKYGYPWTFFIYPDFVTVGEGPGAASWKDLLALQAEGVDIESHSMTHPNLKLHRQKIKGIWQNLTPEQYAEWLKNETAGAKTLLEQKMGKPITCFAYPYGEYNTQVEDAAIAAGYEAIFTVADNPVHATTEMHSIGRYTITQGVVKNFADYLRQGALGLDAADPAPGATITDPRPVITARLGYAGTLDPKSIETSVRDFGDVRHDFDPLTNTLRLYLPRDLIQSVALVNIRVKDAATGQWMVANWHFNYEPAGGAMPIHPPIAPATNAPPASNSQTTAPAPTNARAATEAEPMEKKAAGTPLDAHPVATQPTTD
jgi:peptidoglycan/xylan/chitin deacetylase (PgdA/CDA1 family)